MFSIDLNRFTITEFVETLQKIDLLPGRKILLTGIGQLLSASSEQGMNTLADLQKLLKKKSNYSNLANNLGLSEAYLTVLNREINSYESKPVKIDELGLFSAEEIRRLNSFGIKSTKDCFDRCRKKDDRQKIQQELRIEQEKIEALAQMTDLLRINGVGPAYARILMMMGISGVRDYRTFSSAEILSKYQQTNAKHQFAKTGLGIKDIEYCKRFCDKLDVEME